MKGLGRKLSNDFLYSKEESFRALGKEEQTKRKARRKKEIRKIRM